VDPVCGLPGRLAREAGYQTKAIGKLHVVPERSRVGFEHVVLHPNDYVNWLEDNGYGGMYRGHGLGGNEVYPAVSAVPERFTHTHWIIDNAIAFLSQRDTDFPFFLWLVFEAPHSPFDPPAPYDRMYDNFTVPDPVRGDWCDDDRCPPGAARRRIACKLDQLSPEIVRESRRRYYGQISHIDYQLGRLFGELKTLGLYDNTATVFTADHGEHLGDHGLFGKTTFLRGSADVPLIVRLPRTQTTDTARAVVETPVLTADICPTLLQIAGLDPDDRTDGMALQSLIDGDGSVERTVFGECANSAFAADGRHKYIYYVQGGVEQLFDIINDPYDLRDLSHETSVADARDRLKTALIEHLTKFGRPMVRDGVFSVSDGSVDEQNVRRVNPCAWRGPMRHGRGYYGR